MSEEQKNPFDNDNPNQITAIVNSIDQEPRIVQCIQACNEEKLIEACMLQLYDKVDRIIVIEGAVQSKVAAGQATPDGHSLDRTIEIIEDVVANKDPDRKIIFSKIDRPWADLEELKNAFFQFMQPGEWMLITDADEFLMPSAVDDIRQAIRMEPWATEFVPAGFYHFWRDAHHMRRPDGDWGQQHQRCIKFEQGHNYQNHPVARDKDGVCTYFSPNYNHTGKRFVLPSLVYYHYSYCKDSDQEIAEKKAYYEKELGQEKHGDVGSYARGGQTDEYLAQSEDLTTVLHFDGEHPPAMANHPIVQRKDAFLDAQEDLTNYELAEPYSLNQIPLCWILDKQGNPNFAGLYNTADV